MTVSITSICNRALQHLGASRILGITDDTRNGRACNACYDALRRSELRRHRWLFAKTRVALAPLVETDPHGEFTYIFQLPADCLRVLKPRDHTLDWQILGRKLYTNQSSVLYLEYISDVSDPNQFDALFAESLAYKMAETMCEEITQSNVKKVGIKDDYKEMIREAKRTNAMETIPAEPEDDAWVNIRN